MHIEVISNNTVKIIMSEYDMTDYDICYERLNYKDPDTKRLLIELLQLVRTEKNIDLSNERIFIEAFPCTDGGCMLYISPLSDVAPPARPKSKVSSQLYTGIVCELENLDTLIAMCSQLHMRFSHIVHDSQMYKSERSYRIILYVYNRLEDKLTPLLHEYGKLCGKGEISCSRTREHFTCLLQTNAIETVVTTLC